MFTEQFSFIEYYAKKKLSERGDVYSQKRAAEFLDTTIGKYQAWSKGQYPSIEELQHLARNFFFNPDWLILGIGSPIQMPLDKPFNKNLVEICDTLSELIRQIDDPITKIAEIGGITTQDLYDCIHTQRFPSVETVAKWVLHYRINANFLLAQVGKPFLTEEQFLERGPLDAIVRQKRGDYDFLNILDDDDDCDDCTDASITQTIEENANVNTAIFNKYEALFTKYETALKENAELREKLATYTGEIHTLSKGA